MPISKIKTSSITADAASINLNIDANTLFVDVANNRVGINDITPAERLEIASSTDTSIRLVTTAASGRDYNITAGGGGNYSSGVFAIRNVTSATTPFAIFQDNIGIGTTGPANKLSVNGGSSQTVASFTSTSGGVFLALANSGATAFIGNDSTSGRFVVQTPGSSYSTKFAVNATGNVYIGAASAALANLNILTSDGTGGIQLIRNSTGNPTSGQSLGTFAWKGVDSANTNAAAEAMIEAVAAENHSGVTAGTNMLFYTKSSGTGPGSSPSERARITSAGNLLVGTITSAGEIARFQTASGATNVGIIAATNGSSYVNFGDTSDANVGFIGYVHTSDYMHFRTNAAEAMRIISTGKVGIGLTNPSAPLHVNGIVSDSLTASSSNFKLQSAGGDGIAMGSFQASPFGSWIQSGYLQDGYNPPFNNGYPLILNPGGGTVLVGARTNDLSATVGWGLNTAGGGGTTVSISNTNEAFTWNNLSTAGTAQLDFRTANVEKGNISWNNATTTYNTASDYRLKNTITPMTGALSKVALLKPCTYKWNIDGSDGEGFIAHELAEVIPQAVTGEKDAMREDGVTPRYQGVDTSFLVATLTAAIQEQQALITQLTERVAALENK